MTVITIKRKRIIKTILASEYTQEDFKKVFDSYKEENGYNISIRIIDDSIIYNTHYTKDDMYDKVLYINDFFFKCKQFGIENGFQMISGFSDNQSYRYSDELAYCKVLYEDSEFNKCDMYFTAETEQVAVIDATHYVIKKIKE